MSDHLQTEILDYMHLYEDVEMTAADIAHGINFPVRSVATKLTWMRGAGLVNNDFGRSKFWTIGPGKLPNPVQEQI